MTEEEQWNEKKTEAVTINALWKSDKLLAHTHTVYKLDEPPEASVCAWLWNVEYK